MLISILNIKKCLKPGLVINFKCLFKRETTWEKIEHVRDIKIGKAGQTAPETAEVLEKV